MAINWNMPAIGNPGNEIASISNMLDSFAEARAKQQAQAQAQAMAERQFQAQQANIKADNARADAQIQMQRDQYAQQQQAAKAKLEKESSDDAYKALPKVMAMAGDMPQAAQAEAQGAGIDMQPVKQDTIDETTALLDGAPMAAQYKFAMPAGRVLDYDTGEPLRAKKNTLQRNVSQANEAIGPLAGSLPSGGRMAPVASALAAAGGTPEEAVKGAIGSAQFAEGQGGMDRRAAMATARAREIKPGQDTDDKRALANAAHALLNQELNREDYKKQINDARDTQKMIDMLQSPNAAAQKMATGIWAKQASGPGAVQQSERDEFVNNVGGKDMKLRKLALEWLGGGEVPEGQRKIFSDAATNIIQRHQAAELSSLQENVRDTFASHPNEAFHQYADWAANRVVSGITGGPKKSGGKASGGGQRKSKEDWVKEFSQ